MQTWISYGIPRVENNKKNRPETPRPTMVVAASKHKGKQKGKGKKGTLKPTKGIQKKTMPKKAKEPKGICFQCGKEGHWKWNCNKYLESLRARRRSIQMLQFQVFILLKYV